MSETELETIKYFLNDKIDTLDRNINSQLGDIKNLISDHLGRCDEDMKGHEDRLQTLEAHKNKATGLMIGISSIAGFVAAIVILVIDKIWRLQP